MDACFKCSEGQYPSSGQHECISKFVVFLSYDKPLGVSLVLYSHDNFSFILITAFVLGIFIKYQDTAMVKASNRSLSFVLLIPLLLSFRCTLLFICQPDNLTCFLKQSVLGVIFTVTLSCLLAKTITLILAFKATKPGSKMKEWVGKPQASSIVLPSSFIQGIFCIVSLIISPPFPDFDMRSIAKKNVLEWSKNSPLLFYHGYSIISSFAIMSFIVAFLGRKLPDIFNEATFITFNVLAFCSVWTSFISTYLASKYLAAVQILSILASSAALLICIFSPKIYIISLKAKINKNSHSWGQKPERLKPNSNHGCTINGIKFLPKLQ